MCRISLLAVVVAVCLSGCAAGSLQAMSDQPRYNTYEGSASLPNGASAQNLAPGVVAHGHTQDDTLLYTGLNADGTPGQVFPFAVTRAILTRGQTEFNAYCIPCHDYAGTGHGMAVRAGFPQPPSLISDAARSLPPGQIFAIITNGLGPMPSYSSQVAVTDRWAIVSYVRALQLSQHATLGDVPPEARNQISPAEAAP